MSSSEGKARIRIARGSSTLEIELVDSNFRPVGSGIGELDVSVDPGVYEIRFREGDAKESQLLKVEPGTQEIPPPPLESTSFESHQEPMLEATRTIETDCASPGPETGGIVVMVRNVRGQEDLPFPPDISTRLSVVDTSLKAVDPTNKRWQQGATHPTDQRIGWALWQAAVKPGGYALRIANSSIHEQTVFQSIWVDPGWQTMIFIPNATDGPATDLASVHIVRVGQWNPSDEASSLAIALESVLAGLREGRPVVPDDLERLLHAKFVNPFLGIAAAHALMLEPRPSRKRLTTVTTNLQRLLPQNPDVIAVAHRARFNGANVNPGRHVTWPPMMYVGYRTLIRADAGDSGVIRDGSPAEDAAVHLLISGLWTTWNAEPKISKSRAIARDIGEAIGILPEEYDPETQRLAAYVKSAAEVRNVSQQEILKDPSVKQLAVATGLTSGKVRGALKDLQAGID